MEPSTEGHREANFQDLARFTVNEKDQICLDGKPIEVKPMGLARSEKIFGFFVGIAVIAYSVVEILSTLKIIQ